MAGSGAAHLRDGDAVLCVRDLVVEFRAGRGRVVHAVSGVSFDVKRGETLGIVGESGCGKSTTARSIVQLPPPTSGSVELDGVELTRLDGEDLRRRRPTFQLVAQDPVSSLNPRATVRHAVAEGLRIWGRGDDADEQVDDILRAVGLDPEAHGDRRPHELSGGQCQRVNIARALVLEPSLIVCDEPVSALDVSVQAQILNLLQDLRERFRLTMVFVTHDLGVVHHVADRVAVMYLGKLCEIGETRSLFRDPRHPYTRLLLSSVPGASAPTEYKGTGVGEIPSPIDPPSGCRFRTRCGLADDRCASEEPVVRPAGPDHHAACHYARSMPVRDGAA